MKQPQDQNEELKERLSGALEYMQTLFNEAHKRIVELEQENEVRRQNNVNLAAKMAEDIKRRELRIKQLEFSLHQLLPRTCDSPRRPG